MSYNKFNRLYISLSVLLPEARQRQSKKMPYETWSPENKEIQVITKVMVSQPENRQSQIDK